jgi:hypothetical protein
MSGVDVPTIIKSRSSAGIPAISSALRAAGVARSLNASPGIIILRSLIPVRVVIHSFVVSIICSKYELGTTLSGEKEPVPTIYIFLIWQPSF